GAANVTPATKLKAIAAAICVFIIKISYGKFVTNITVQTYMTEQLKNYLVIFFNCLHHYLALFMIYL
ncbi:hypothetical protein, partial [Acinetobacter sp.]|uniref:hypothetical protein n=1 Tax=Acinetobacter sp. TaxID=472 RepID=UPI00257C3A48